MILRAKIVKIEDKDIKVVLRLKDGEYYIILDSNYDNEIIESMDTIDYKIDEVLDRYYEVYQSLISSRESIIKLESLKNDITSSIAASIR